MRCKIPKYIICIVTLLCICKFVYAQSADTANKQKEPTTASKTAIVTVKKNGYIIKGKIKDASTSEGIPFATVFFPKSAIGTPADIDGNFILQVEQLPNDTIRVQAIGYHTFSKVISHSIKEQELNIELERNSTQMNELVIHAGVDPALFLLKQIIKHKPLNNPDRNNNYSYRAYNKLEVDVQRLSKEQFEKIPGFKNYSFIFENLDSSTEDKPFLPLFMTEAMSDYYFQRAPKQQKEFIRASLIKGFKNESLTEFMGTSYQNFNVYNNFLPVFDKQFVSPISNSGAAYYNYVIKDTEKAYGHNIILVQFSPKREGELCFSGDFWVIDSVFAIERVSLEVPRLANINFVNRVSLYQEFAPVDDSIWFCVKDKFVSDFNAPYGTKLPGLIGRKTTLYSNIKVNDTMVCHVLNNTNVKEDVIIDDSAKYKTEDWWSKARFEPLSKNEQKIYKMVDTIEQMPITRYYKNIIKFLVNGTRDVGPLQLGPYFYVYSRNSIEGNRFRLTLGTPECLTNIHLTGYLAYGDKDNKFKYGFTGIWILDHKPRMSIYGAYTHDIDHSTNYYDKVGNDNIFSSLIRKSGIPWKLAWADEYELEFFKDYHKGFSNKLRLLHREFTPYAPLPGIELFKDDAGNPTPTIINTEAEFSLRFAYKEKYLDGKYKRISLGSKYPILNLRIGVAIKDVWNSDYSYQRIRFTLSDHAPLPHLGNVYYSLFAGKYFGTLPYPLLEIVPGNEYHYYNAHAFEMMNKYEFIADEYAGFIFEHNFGSGIFKYIPIIKKAKLRQFYTVKGIIGSLSDANKALNFKPGIYPFRSLEGNPYVEVGTGISNILEFFRIDFVWRVCPAPLIAEERSRYFGVFVSAQFDF